MPNFEKDNVFWKKIDGNNVLLNVESGFYYVLNDVASLIWDAWAQDRSPSEIAMLLSSEFKVSFQQAKKDVSHFLTRLKRERLIETYTPDHKNHKPSIKPVLARRKPYVAPALNKRGMFRMMAAGSQYGG